METKNSTYIILTIILLILSGVGGYFLFQNLSSKSETTYNSNTVPKIELIPTDTLDEPEISTSSSITTTPITTSTAKTTITPTKIVTATPTKKLTPTAIPTANELSQIDYSSEEDSFSVSYSSKRKLYQDIEPSGSRYTFSGTTGNFAVHVSPSTKWSWSNPDRQFSESQLVSGQPTFRYDIAAQTIIDLQSSDKNYTIQCVHNGIASLKTECEAFISSFKLL